jgi:shikimate kinase
LAGLLLSGCSHAAGGGAESANVHPGGAVGYVRMDDLVKRHPLYGQLARLDDDMAALQLKSVGGAAAVSPGDLAREQKELQAELDRATERTRAALKEKQDEYSKREAAAIQQALAAAGSVPAGGGAAIAGSAERKLQEQAQAVTAGAEANLQRYRRDVLTQNQAALQALQRSLNDKAARIYRTQAEALQKKEADYALQLANDNSAERLSLRAKLSNLVLDDAAREDARKAIEALDRKESDALAALKNRDGATLAALQTKLRAQTQSELDAQAAQMNKAALGKINARELQARKEVVATVGNLAPARTQGAGALPPDMRAKLEALHKKYQADFDKDAKTTLDDFQKTRTQLAERFQRMRGVDGAAQEGSTKQLQALQHQRDQLYDQMVAQIGREVKLIAAKRGIAVVFGDVVAPAGGVDLTDDAEKDIETLHE